MRRPLRAEPPGRRAAGFTLIELLVVLVILGTLLSLAVLSTGGGRSRELQGEAQRLAALIGVLSDEAVLENREYGLLIDDEGYRVLVFDEARDRWTQLPGEEKEHELPAWTRLDLELDGQPLKLAAPVRQGEDEQGPGGEARQASRRQNTSQQNTPKLPEPQLLVLSSGELSPFRLLVAERERQGDAYALSSDGFQLPRAERVETRR